MKRNIMSLPGFQSVIVQKDDKIIFQYGDVSYDKDKKELTMEKISGMNLSDFYGENIIDVPCNIIKEVQTIIKTLKFYNIIYPDITGYNFIEDKNGVVWIVDFGHAYIREPEQPVDSFVLDFLNGHNGWNPEFA